MDQRFAGSCYTHLRIDALFFGVFIAYFAKFRAEGFLGWVRSHSCWFLAAGLVLVSPSLKYEETDSLMMVPGFTSMYAGFGLPAALHALSSVERTRRSARTSHGPARLHRPNSYSVYLWHFPVMYISPRQCPPKAKTITW